MQQVRTRHWHWHCSTSSCCGRVVLISVLGTSSCCGPRQEEERETEPTWPPPEAEQTCETAEMLLWPLRLSHRGDRLTLGSLAIRLSRETAGGEQPAQAASAPLLFCLQPPHDHNLQGNPSQNYRPALPKSWPSETGRENKTGVVV